MGTYIITFSIIMMIILTIVAIGSRKTIIISNACIDLLDYCKSILDSNDISSEKLNEVTDILDRYGTVSDRISKLAMDDMIPDDIENLGFKGFKYLWVLIGSGITMAFLSYKEIIKDEEFYNILLPYIRNHKL